MKDSSKLQGKSEIKITSEFYLLEGLEYDYIASVRFDLNGNLRHTTVSWHKLNYIGRSDNSEKKKKLTRSNIFSFLLLLTLVYYVVIELGRMAFLFILMIMFYVIILIIVIDAFIPEHSNNNVDINQDHDKLKRIYDARVKFLAQPGYEPTMHHLITIKNGLLNKNSKYLQFPSRLVSGYHITKNSSYFISENLRYSNYSVNLLLIKNKTIPLEITINGAKLMELNQLLQRIMTLQYGLVISNFKPNDLGFSVYVNKPSYISDENIKMSRQTMYLRSFNLFYSKLIAYTPMIMSSYLDILPNKEKIIRTSQLEYLMKMVNITGDNSLANILLSNPTLIPKSDTIELQIENTESQKTKIKMLFINSPSCIICKQEILPDHQKGYCTYCDQVYHLDHLKLQKKLFNKCALCGYSILESIN